MSDVPLSKYTPARVAVCPCCQGDLIHEGTDYYACPAGCKPPDGDSFYFTQVELVDEEDYEDD